MRSLNLHVALCYTIIPSNTNIINNKMILDWKLVRSLRLHSDHCIPSRDRRTQKKRRGDLTTFPEALPILALRLHAVKTHQNMLWHRTYSELQRAGYEWEYIVGGQLCRQCTHNLPEIAMPTSAQAGGASSRSYQAWRHSIRNVHEN